MYPMKLIAPLKDYLWGGTRLRDEYGKETQMAKVAESWELACHRDGMSVIANGAAAGQPLVDWIAAEGVGVLGTKAARFPYFPLLIKLIDRECNMTGYNIAKAFIGTFNANVYQGLAFLFGQSLTKHYDPEGDDRYTERVVRMVESGQI